MEALYILVAVISVFVSIAKPLYGIIFLLFNLQIQPHTIFHFQQGATQYANLIIGAILFIKLPFYKQQNPETGISLLAILFFISASVSSLLNFGIDFFSDENQIDIFSYFLKRVMFLLLFVRYISTRKAFFLVLKTLVVLGSATAVYTILDWVFHLSSTVEIKGGRAIGVVGDPNRSAADLVALIPLTYYLFLYGKSKWLKMTNLLAIGAMVLGIFFSVSRGGLLALTIIGGSIAKKNIRKYSTFIIVGLMLVLFSVYAKDLYLERHTIQTSLSGKTSIDNSSSQRLILMKYGLQIWIRNPLFGVGAENTLRNIRDILEIRGVYSTVHNIFLLILTEFGLVGFSLYMGFFLLAFKALSRLARHPDTYFNEIAVYLRLALLSHVITSSFIGNWVDLMLWITIALPIILDQILKNEQHMARQG